MLRNWRVILVAFCFFFLFQSAQVLSSDQSKASVQKGYKLLTKKSFEGALKQFEAASKSDPNDGEALFFHGVALNRLGQFAEAGEKLDQAKKLGSHPEWNFERGWSYLGLKEWKKAIANLKNFERKNPGKGQTSEFIGRAYFGLGDNEKAERHLKEAIHRDSNLKKTSDIYLSAMAAAGQPRSEKQKNWRIYSNVGGTYNTNAINLGRGVARPTNISRQESGFVNGTLGGSYRFDLSDSSQLSLGHQVLSNLYEVNNRLNFLDNYTFAMLRHTFDKTKVLGVTVSNDFSIVQTAKFRNQIGFRPVFGWRLKDWLVSELGYNFGLAEYFFPSNAAQNRDAHSHMALLNNYFLVPKTKLRFRLGYSHLWNRADGADFDYKGNNLIFGFSETLFKELTAELSFSQAWNRYSNVNSLTATTRRSDNVSNLFAQFNYPFIWKLKGFLHAGYTRNKSNIRTFNYRSWQGGGGLSAEF